MRTVALAALVLWGGETFAHAHDLGCDGRPVPVNIKAACCGPADYHRVSYADITEDAHGYVVVSNGYTFHVPREEALPTPDGCPAIFYNDVVAAAGTTSAYCFFYDPGT